MVMSVSYYMCENKNVALVTVILALDLTTYYLLLPRLFFLTFSSMWLPSSFTVTLIISPEWCEVGDDQLSSNPKVGTEGGKSNLIVNLSVLGIY